MPLVKHYDHGRSVARLNSQMLGLMCGKGYLSGDVVES